MLNAAKTNNSKMRKMTLVLLTGFTFQVNTQNIFPVKMNDCKTDMFCVDCGDTEAGFEQENYISTMAFDNNGNLYLATRQGLVKVERK